MDYTNRIKTVNMDELSDFERIDQNLRNLIITLIETIPGSRGFGLPVEITDLMPEQARNEFAAALDEKIEEYIPEILVTNIEFVRDEEGNMDMQITVEANDDYTEGDEDEDD